MAGALFLGLIGGSIGKSIWNQRTGLKVNPAMERVLREHGAATPGVRVGRQLRLDKTQTGVRPLYKRNCSRVRIRPRETVAGMTGRAPDQGYHYEWQW